MPYASMLLHSRTVPRPREVVACRAKQYLQAKDQIEMLDITSLVVVQYSTGKDFIFEGASSGAQAQFQWLSRAVPSLT